MAALAPPWTPSISSIRWTLESNVSRFVSPLTKSTQLSAKAGALWRARVRLTQLSDTELRQWTSFLARCQDEGRSFFWGPSYTRGRPLAYAGTDTIPWGAGGTAHPTVSAASQTGFQLTATGFSAAATMKRGDWFSFHNGYWRELHRLTKDVTADGSGNATLDFVPAIRISPPITAELWFDGYQTDPFQRAAGEFVISAPDGAAFGESFDMTNEVEFDVVESLYAYTPDTRSDLAAWFRWKIGTTTSGSGVDLWADQSGNSRNLVQATDTNRPARNSDYSITFDGVDNYLKTSTYTHVQPVTRYIAFQQLTWTLDDVIFDGNTAASGALYQSDTTPKLRASAGSAIGSSSLTLNTKGVVACVFNGASSVIQINLGSAETGNAGAGNPGALTLGCRGDIANFSNIKVYEAIDFSTAHDAAARRNNIEYLANRIGLNVSP